MPTYASTSTFDLTIDEIATEAYERCGIEVRDGLQLKTARRSLDILIAEWANRGLNLWTIELRTKTLTASTSSYSLDADLVDVLSASLYTASDTTVDKQVDRISRAEYLHISKKSTEGTPTQYYLLRGQSTPTLYVYPTPDAADTFKYFGLTRINDAGDYTNNAEVPFRFLPALTAGLSYYIAMKRAPERIPLLKQVYEEQFGLAADEDRNRASLNLVPARSYY